MVRGMRIRWIKALEMQCLSIPSHLGDLQFGSVFSISRADFKFATLYKDCVYDSRRTSGVGFLFPRSNKRVSGICACAGLRRLLTTWLLFLHGMVLVGWEHLGVLTVTWEGQRQPWKGVRKETSKLQKFNDSHVSRTGSIPNAAFNRRITLASVNHHFLLLSLLVFHVQWATVRRH